MAATEQEEPLELALEGTREQPVKEQEEQHMDEREAESKLLRKQGWFLGELSTEAAGDILQSCNEFNVFIVYETTAGDYYLSAKTPIEGMVGGLVEHLLIMKTDEGYHLLEQSEAYPSIVEAVNVFTVTKDPPLSPALGKKQQLEAQFSISSISAPPAYDEANKRLQPDIAPLPKIDDITPVVPEEAKAGKISPSGSFRGRNDSYLYNYNYSRRDTPPHVNNSHMWRYRDKSRCHPKNVCHCCCYRETYWTGYRESYSHKWYNCKGTGFLRCLLLVLMWSLVWPCVGIGFCVFGCFLLCFFGCCYDGDDD